MVITMDVLLEPTTNLYSSVSRVQLLNTMATIAQNETYHCKKGDEKHCVYAHT